MTSNVEAFDKAAASVTQERGETYGHPAIDFARVAQMKDAIKDCPDARIRHALEMILVKVARLTQTPTHLDSVIDIAGYARTIAMILDKDKSSMTLPKIREGCSWDYVRNYCKDPGCIRSTPCVV